VKWILRQPRRWPRHAGLYNIFIVPVAVSWSEPLTNPEIQRWAFQR
jgi:hypothetical protein